MACGRLPDATRFVITPSGMDYRAITPNDLPVVNLDAELVEGTRRPSTETPMIARVLARRPDIGAIAHTHSTVATGFAAARTPIPPVLAELAEAIGGEVPCAEYARFGTVELAERVLAVAGEKRAVLLAHHGVIAFGETVEDATDAALVVEEAARVALVCRLLGGGDALGVDEVAALRQVHLTRYGQPRESSGES